jgi:acyl-CoA synthetase (AMP-forming)/AMP-acid ligase II
MEIPKFTSYWQYVKFWSKQDPDFPSLREGDRIITAKDFEEITDQLAKAFIHMGVQKGDRIATILPSGIDYVLTMIAAGKINAILVPLDVKFRVADLERFLSHSNPKVLVALPQVDDFDVVQTLKSLGSNFDDIQKVLVGSSDFGTSFQDLLEKPLELDEELIAAKKDLHKDDGALIIFTGGTTGVPKAALLSHENMTLMSHIEGEYFNKFVEPYGITGRWKTVAALPPSHVGGTVECIGAPICFGLQILLYNTWSPVEYLEVIQKEKIPFIGGVPTMLAIILSLPNLDQYDLSPAKAVLMSGEKVPLELIEGVRSKITDTVIIGYGSTEAGAETNFTEPGEDSAKIADGYVGKPLPTVAVKIVDDNEQPLKIGEVGEIVVSGPLAIKSYFKMPKEDKAGFTSDGWVKTGDNGYLDEDGGLYIIGRKKHIIRVGSYTVLPTEVEEVAIKDPGVAMAAAIGVPDKIYGEVIWLCVVPEPGKAIHEENIMSLCKKELAKFKAPQKILVRDMLPMTRLGKTDRITLQKEIVASVES